MDIPKLFGILKSLMKIEDFNTGDEIVCDGHTGNTSAKLIAANKVTDFFYPFETFLIKYLTCKMNLVVEAYNEPCDNFEGSQKLCFFYTNFSAEQMQSSIYSVASHLYMVELLTVLKYDEDLSYFSFAKLFSIKIWMYMAISLLSYSCIFYLYHQDSPNIFDTTLEFLKNLLGESSDLLDKWRRDDQMLSVAIGFWVLSCAVIQWAFTSLLLGVYFLKKTSLTFNTLEDLATPGLHIGGYGAFKSLEQFRPDIFNKFKDSVIEYDVDVGNCFTPEGDKPLLYLLNSQMVKELIDRRAVFTVNSYFAGVFKKLYPGANLEVSHHKYVPQYSYTYVDKTIFTNTTTEKVFYSMMKIIFETGWTYRFFRLYEIIAEVYSTTHEPWLQNVRDIIDEPDSSAVLRLSMCFRNPFAALILGIGISIILLFCELSYAVRT